MIKRPKLGCKCRASLSRTSSEALASSTKNCSEVDDWARTSGESLKKMMAKLLPLPKKITETPQSNVWARVCSCI